jgi:DNA invertase Pin-like site-specific DNA recombinase
MQATKPARSTPRHEPALSYLRVSGRGQLNGDGFPRQRDVIARYARTHGIDVLAEYRDEGVSGTRDLDGRDGLGELLERVRSNGVRLVLVERADRLARDLLVGEVILNQFRDLDVRVVAADSGTELTANDRDPTRVLIRQVLGAVAEFEKATTVIKLRAARVRQRRVAGVCEGRKPYGHRPGEQDVIARMRRLRRKPRGGERLSYAAIAGRLNAEGVAARMGRPWRASSVHSILRRVSGSC